MKFWKFGIALSLTAAFGLIACNDTSSSTDDKDAPYEAGTIGCKGTSQKPFVQEVRMDDLTITTTMTLEEGVVVETIEYNKPIPADSCEHYKLDQNYAKVTCNDKSIKAVNKDKSTEAEFEALTQIISKFCKESNGQKIPDNGSKDDIKFPDIEKCTEANKGKEIEIIKDKGVFIACDGEKWTPSKTECTDTTKVQIATLSLACKDGKWTLESDKECENGKTEKMTFPNVEVSATCVDKVWQIDAPKAETEPSTTESGATTTEE